MILRAKFESTDTKNGAESGSSIRFYTNKTFNQYRKHIVVLIKYCKSALCYVEHLSKTKGSLSLRKDCPFF